MFNIIQYPQDTHFLKPIGQLSFGVFLHEIITYPLDRLCSRAIATQQSSHFQQIWQTEKLRGLFKGMSTSIDKSLIQHISLYFTFQYLFNKYGLDINQRCELEPQGYPLLKYCQGERFYLIAFGSSLISTILSQTSNIVKLKVQCEQLGIGSKKRSLSHLDEIMEYHGKSLGIGMTPGFRSRVLLTFGQFITELQLMSIILEKNNYLFMNRLGNDNSKKDFPLIEAFGVSFAVPIAFHPLFYLQKRYTMRKLQNMQKLSILQMLQLDGDGLNNIYRGSVTHSIRYCSRNMLLFFIMWNSSIQKQEL